MSSHYDRQKLITITNKRINLNVHKVQKNNRYKFDPIVRLITLSLIPLSDAYFFHFILKL